MNNKVVYERSVMGPSFQFSLLVYEDLVLFAKFVFGVAKSEKIKHFTLNQSHKYALVVSLH